MWSLICACRRVKWCGFSGIIRHSSTLAWVSSSVRWIALSSRSWCLFISTQASIIHRGTPTSTTSHPIPSLICTTPLLLHSHLPPSLPCLLDYYSTNCLINYAPPSITYLPLNLIIIHTNYSPTHLPKRLDIPHALNIYPLDTAPPS